MDKTVNTAQIDEYAIGGDVLDGTLEHLTLLELSDDLAFLLLELGLDECLVGYNHILELLVDLYNLELHGLAHEDIIVADGLDINLRSGKERLDAEHVDNHATLGTALDVTLDNLVIAEGFVDALPRTGCTGLAVREDELAFLVLLVLNEHFHNVTDLNIGIVTELVHRDDTVALVSDVNHSLTLVERNNGTFDYIFVLDGVE